MTPALQTINLNPVTLNHPQPQILKPKPYQEQENQTLPARRTLGKYNDDNKPNTEAQEEDEEEDGDGEAIVRKFAGADL